MGAIRTGCVREIIVPNIFSVFSVTNKKSVLCAGSSMAFRRIFPSLPKNSGNQMNITLKADS